MPTPSVANLSLFKGIVKLMLSTETEYRDLGECSAFTTSMEVETLVYQSRRSSSRIPVKTQVLGKTMTCALTMSEMAEENLELWLLAEREGSPPDSFLSIGLAAEKRGALRIVGTNEVGQVYQVDLPDVLLTPTGDLAWLTDADWSEAQLQGQINAINGSFGTVRAITAGVEEMVGSPAI